jgi:acetylornithine/N-succinyldiaminopimelate aminotransferase
MSMTMEELIAQGEQDLLHTYNRYPIVLDHGEGVYLYDLNGKKYLDFMAGIAVFAFGYGNREYNDALKLQIDKILHTSNYFYNEPAIRAAHLLKQASGMDRVFFTNSGAESNEGALKAAEKYASLKDGTNGHEIIAMENSFHGRTYGALSVTGNAHYRESFGTLPCDVKFAKFNDLDSVASLVTDRTAAVILEPVQGEGGLNPATREFLEGVRRPGGRLPHDRGGSSPQPLCRRSRHHLRRQSLCLRRGLQGAGDVREDPPRRARAADHPVLHRRTGEDEGAPSPDPGAARGRPDAGPCL